MQSSVIKKALGRTVLQSKILGAVAKTRETDKHSSFVKRKKKKEVKHQRQVKKSCLLEPCDMI